MSTIGKLFSKGAGMFALGFFIWNMDNIFCDTLTRWKVFIGWPRAFLLEGMPVHCLRIHLLWLNDYSGHSWWHVLTVSISCSADVWY
jgi:dihydroceramidase